MQSFIPEKRRLEAEHGQGRGARTLMMKLKSLGKINHQEFAPELAKTLNAPMAAL